MSLKQGYRGISQPSTSAMGLAEPAENSVKIQTNPSRRYSIMQFNRGDNVDMSKWKQAKMERENNLREFKSLNPDMPTSGAGSEFGRERREEARRKKYGVARKKYREEDQPWILKQIGAQSRKYRGKKEGLINEISSYYIFKQTASGSFEAVPIDCWYSFKAVAKHKTLNAEEAEEEFGRRDRTFNFFTLMVKKRLKESAGEVLSKEEEDEMKNKTKTTKTRKKDDLRITEDDDYQDLMTSGESDAYMSSEEDDDAGKSKGKKKDQKKTKRKKKKQDSDDEAEEESDEGDFDCRELDYISEDSSDDEEEQQKVDIKGLDEELQKIEDEEEEEEEEEEGEGEGEKEKEVAEPKDQGEKKEKVAKKEDESSSSSGSDDSDDSDIDDNKIHPAMLMQKKPSKRPETPTNRKAPSKNPSRNASRPETPTQSATNVPNTPGTTGTLSDAATKLQQERVAVKRPVTPGTDDATASKRQKTEGDSPVLSKTPGKEAPGLTEDVIRRYLMRKPMTTRDLLYKVKSKKIGLTPEEVVKRITEILRKLNPKQQKIKDKKYWFIPE